MPPHCDALDGPVVNGARQALNSGDATFALQFVPEEAEAEARAAFDQVRASTDAVLGLEVYANTLYRAATTGPHTTHHIEGGQAPAAH